ncbi:MAG: hypothetical protein HZA84_01875 [Thaumarchaeota archaeon]|nr:hypothetical protein [Nitrososphaerota archaeon]
MAVTIIAFWGFGLAEKIMPQERIPQITDVLSDNLSEPITQNQIISSASADTESKNTSDPMYEKKPSVAEKPVKPVSRLESLEKREFSLSLSGTYYAGSPGASRPASLEMKVHPIPGTNLENFEVIEAKMMFDNSGIPIEHPSITVTENHVYLTFVSDAVGSFVIKGVLDESPLLDKNNKQTIVIENQMFYLAQKDLPYNIDMTGIMSNY